jgi:hypothetical protein
MVGASRTGPTVLPGSDTGWLTSRKERPAGLLNRHSRLRSDPDPARDNRQTYDDYQNVGHQPVRYTLRRFGHGLDPPPPAFFDRLGRGEYDLLHGTGKKLQFS